MPLPMRTTIRCSYKKIVNSTKNVFDIRFIFITDYIYDIQSVTNFADTLWSADIVFQIRINYSIVRFVTLRDSLLHNNSKRKDSSILHHHSIISNPRLSKDRARLHPDDLLILANNTISLSIDGSTHLSFVLRAKVPEKTPSLYISSSVYMLMLILIDMRKNTSDRSASTPLIV